LNHIDSLLIDMVAAPMKNQWFQNHLMTLQAFGFFKIVRINPYTGSALQPYRLRK
jgi:hypothetical protein